MSGEDRATQGLHSLAKARFAGLLIIASAILSSLLMMQHPTIDAHSAQQAIAKISRETQSIQWVHGMLIVLIGTTLVGYLEVSSRLGRDRLVTQAGLLCYGIGAGSMTGAALISGFLVPAITARNTGQDDFARVLDLINFAGASNQVLAKFGVVAISLGILLWSAALLRKRALALVVCGASAGIAPVLMLALGAMQLNVSGMLAVLLIQNVWNVLVGVFLLRNRL